VLFEILSRKRKGSFPSAQALDIKGFPPGILKFKGHKKSINQVIVKPKQLPTSTSLG